MSVKRWILWIVTVLLAALFINAGIQKYPTHGAWATQFARWGYPVWFRYTIGVAEVAAGLLLLYPRTAAWGAGMIMAIMVGAAGTQILDGALGGVISTIVFFTVAGIVLKSRLHQAVRPWRTSAG